MFNESFPTQEFPTVEQREQEINTESRTREDIRRKVEAGEIEPSSEIKDAVGASSRAFWEKFDEYVKGIRHGEQISAPSRNKHLLTATEALKSSTGLSGDNYAIAVGYWGKMYNEAVRERNIPVGKNVVEKMEIMDDILYRGKIPESVKVPE
ncbi:MAG: hypothetical protein AAB682_02235 [Patescibacteria group bacterium]